ncbi:MAG: hypothetical protein QM645_06480 [Asticcacaulis sp.]
MTLEQAIFDGMAKNCFYTIVSRKPFATNSDSLIVYHDNGDADLDASIKQGYAYFLDSEDLNPIFLYASQKKLSYEKIMEMILYYAEYDAYPSWTNTI